MSFRLTNTAVGSQVASTILQFMGVTASYSCIGKLTLTGGIFLQSREVIVPKEGVKLEICRLSLGWQ